MKKLFVWDGYRRYYAESGSLQQNAIGSYAPSTIQEFVMYLSHKKFFCVDFLILNKQIQKNKF